jgi:hypothetical protein
MEIYLGLGSNFMTAVRKRAAAMALPKEMSRPEKCIALCRELRPLNNSRGFEYGNRVERC